MNQKIRLLLFIIFYSLLNQLWSQNTIAFEHINESKGLSGNSVLTILQDYEGFMWFGTRYGLNRYDAYSINNYYNNPHDRNSIQNNYTSKIFEDSKQELWVATNSGISRYDRTNDQFVRITIANNDVDISKSNFVDMLEDEYGNFWLLTTHNLVQSIAPQKGSDSIQIKEIYPFNENRLKCLLLDRNGTIWLGTEQGLFFIKGKEIWPFNFIVSDNNISNFDINAIYSLKDGNLALATENTGLLLLNPSKRSVFSRFYVSDNDNSLVNNRVRTVFQADNGNVWIGTREGLSILNIKNNEIKNFTHKSIDLKSISDNSIKTIYADMQGGIWLGTYAGGVNYYHEQNSKFEHIKRDFLNRNTISSDKVSFLYKDKDSILWLGTEGRGLNRIDETNGEVKSYSKYEGLYEAIDNIKSIVESEEPYLWLGTNGGLSRFNRLTGAFKNYFYNPNDSNSLSYNQIHSLVYDSGVLWIATNGGGLNKYIIKENKFSAFKKGKHANSIVSNNINHLLKERGSGIWIGTENGLDFLLLNKQTFDRSFAFMQLQEKLARAKILVLFSDKQGYLWIGTEGKGVFCVNKKNYKLQEVTGKDEIIGRVIYAFQQDDESNIWISTNKGLTRLSVNYSNDSILITRVNNYKKKDGLQGNQFSYRASLKDKHGKLYFGGIHGYNAFYPNEIMKTLRTPRVVFTNLEINYKKVRAGEKDFLLNVDITQASEITLKFSQQPVSITFAGLNYINPEYTFYSYMLVGVDEGWIKSGKQRKLTYTHLNEGIYELRVKASTNNNEWHSNFSSLKIEVLPPYWRTWWAYMLYALLLLLIVGGILLYTNNWFRLKNKLALEKLSKEKEQELNEKKLRFFTDISHELRTPLTLIISPLEKLVADSSSSFRFNKEVKAIERNSKKMLLLIDQLLDLRKFEKGHTVLEVSENNLAVFLEETTLSFRELAIEKGLKFNFITSSTDISLWFDISKMEIIIYNLLSNAFKAVNNNGMIEVRLLEVEKADKYGNNIEYVKIEIEDNGKGIPKKDLKNIFNRFYQLNRNTRKNLNSSGIGLELTMRMIKLHEGEINVESSEANKKQSGKTVFTVLIPKENNYPANYQITNNKETDKKESYYTTELLTTELYDYQIDSENNLNEILDFGTDKPVLMIVEDDDEVRKFVSSLFTNHYRVKTAVNGKNAWTKIVTDIPDIIISDIMMPEMDGLELCRIIKTDKRTSHIPVILLTAKTSVTFKYEGMETGADDYISKPFSAKYLAMRVKGLLLQRKQIQDHFFRNSIIQPKELGISSLDQTLIKNAIQYIEENLDNSQLSVVSLSIHLGLSRVHLYRKLKSITNITAVEFIRNIRLKRAAQLFEAGNHSVKEVRYAVGIGDATNFRNSFKKLYGVTPSEFIKQQLS